MHAWQAAVPAIRSDEEAELVARTKTERLAGNYDPIARIPRHYGFRSFAPGLLKGMLGERRPAFDSSMQQDGHEAFIELLDLLHEELAVEHEELKLGTGSNDTKSTPVGDARPKLPGVLLR